jgi:stearoyl-CoA desaturase (delta-9 desaturase)
MAMTFLNPGEEPPVRPSTDASASSDGAIARPAQRGGAVMLVVAGLHALALAALAFPFEWKYLPVMVGLYLWMGFSTTVYLHRHLAHRGFEMAEPLRVFFTAGAALGFMRNPIWWAGQHRVHHQKTDRPGDVHSPLDGIFHSHVGWVGKAAGHAREHYRAAKDLKQTWYTRLFGPSLHQMALNLMVAAVLVAVWGPGAALWCLYVPVVLFMNVTWSVNSVCHLVGYRSFNTPDQSRNNTLIGLLALGEGYHNNHHARPQRVPAGLKWYEPDASSALIWLLERLGLVWNVRWSA